MQSGRGSERKVQSCARGKEQVMASYRTGNVTVTDHMSIDQVQRRPFRLQSTAGPTTANKRF